MFAAYAGMLAGAFAGLLGSCSGDVGGGLVVPMPDADLSGVTSNPDGIAYPTTNIGGQPRSAKGAGQILPNLILPGIRSVATWPPCRWPSTTTRPGLATIYCT